MSRLAQVISIPDKHERKALVQGRVHEELKRQTRYLLNKKGLTWDVIIEAACLDLLEMEDPSGTKAMRLKGLLRG